MTHPDDGWRTEIVELHAFFEAYFLGTLDSLDRFEKVLAPSFTIVSPHGTVQDRAAVIEAVRAAHGHSESLAITTTDHRLLARRNGVLVAEYIEHHELPSRTNHRCATVVFESDADTPHGVAWLRVHETWLPEGVG